MRGTVVVGAGGTWSVSVTITLGGHSLAATQTTATLHERRKRTRIGHRLRSAVRSVSITSDDGAVSASATVYGHSVAGGNVQVYEGGASRDGDRGCRRELDLLALDPGARPAHADGACAGSGFRLLELVERVVHGGGRSECAGHHFRLDAGRDDDVGLGDGRRHGRGGYTVKVTDDAEGLGRRRRWWQLVGVRDPHRRQPPLRGGADLDARWRLDVHERHERRDDRHGLRADVRTVLVLDERRNPEHERDGLRPVGRPRQCSALRGATLIANATADGSGNWTATLPLLSVGRHTLTARVQDQNSGFWSSFSSSLTVTIVPDAPSITSMPTPSPATPTAPVTVNGMGVIGYTVKVYDGSFSRRLPGSSVQAACGRSS